jgi:hypothetical protein
MLRGTHLFSDLRMLNDRMLKLIEQHVGMIDTENSVGQRVLTAGNLPTKSPHMAGFRVEHGRESMVIQKSREKPPAAQSLLTVAER